MNPATFSSFGRALAASLLLHVLLLAYGAQLLALLPKPPRSANRPLEVRLAEAARVQPPVLSQPELHMQEHTVREAQAGEKAKVAKPPAPVREEKPAPAPSGSRALTGFALRRAHQQISQELFYPPEAIAQGLEGEVLVLLFLDAGGNAIAARVEASSGHPILDEAAVRAARTLKGLPASAPREALVPVRFRLQ